MSPLDALTPTQSAAAVAYLLAGLERQLYALSPAQRAGLAIACTQFVLRAEAAELLTRRES